MEYFLWNLTTISSYGLGFCLVWGILVLGASEKQRKKSAADRHLDFVIKGKTQAYTAAVIMIFPAAYMIITGAIDAFVSITITIGFSLAASALWRTANAMGFHAFTSHKEWRNVRLKTYIQALCLTAFGNILGHSKTYLEHDGYF